MDTAIESGTVDVGTATIYYQSIGTGDPLLMLHNFGTSSETWMPFIGPLAVQRRVIAMDSRGHGRSTNQLDVFDHAQAAEDAVAVMTALGHPVFDAIGSSSGGMTLLHLAVRNPGRVRAMVLVGATTHLPQTARAFAASATVDHRVWKALARFSYSEEQVATLSRQFRSFATMPDDVAFTPHHLSLITARTLVVQGDRDPLFPPEIAIELFRGIPGASLCVMPGAGHTPQLEGRAEELLAIAKTFLDTPAPATTA